MCTSTSSSEVSEESIIISITITSLQIHNGCLHATKFFYYYTHFTASCKTFYHLFKSTVVPELQLNIPLYMHSLWLYISVAGFMSSNNVLFFCVDIWFTFCYDIHNFYLLSIHQPSVYDTRLVLSKILSALDVSNPSRRALSL